jgi:hypothetical protein
MTTVISRIVVNASMRAAGSLPAGDYRGSMPPVNGRETMVNASCKLQSANLEQQLCSLQFELSYLASPVSGQLCGAIDKPLPDG